MMISSSIQWASALFDAVRKGSCRSLFAKKSYAYAYIVFIAGIISFAMDVVVPSYSSVSSVSLRLVVLTISASEKNDLRPPLFRWLTNVQCINRCSVAPRHQNT
jgi:hypothetical protein